MTNSVHIDKSVYWRFAFDQQKTSQLFGFKVKIKVSNRCLPIWYLPYRIGVCRCVMSPYPRRLLVVYLTLKAMRRPRFVDKQLEVCVFCIYYWPQQGGAVGGWAKDERRSGEGWARDERRSSSSERVTKPEKGWLDNWVRILKIVNFWLDTWKGWPEYGKGLLIKRRCKDTTKNWDTQKYFH